MEKLITLFKRPIIIWFTILLPIYSIIFIYLSHFSYTGWIYLALLYTMLGLCLILRYYHRHKSKEFSQNLTIAMILLTVSIPQLHKSISLLFINKGEKTQLCEKIEHIQYSWWDDNYFYLANHDIKFNLNQHKKAKIDDKVCITFNPNQKWLGYAYIFNIEKQ